MDLQKDNLVEDVLDVGKVLSGFAGGIRRKAQLKKALNNIKNGNLAALDGASLDRLQEAGVNPAFYSNSPAYIARYGSNTGIGARVENPNAVVTVETSTLKTYLPYILGALGVGILVFVILKKNFK